MKTQNGRKLVSLALLAHVLGLAALFLAGCGHKDEPAPTGGSGTYYTGPMAKKPSPGQPK